MRNKNKKESTELSIIEKTGQVTQIGNKTIIKVEEIPPFQNMTVLTDPNDVKGIKKIETLIRCSYEYNKYTQYLKNNLNMNMCSFFHNIKASKTLRIELHHAPFTLFDITQSVVNRHIQDHGYAYEFDVANEVMYLHYENIVGLIPLSPTVHQLVHNFKVDVHPSQPKGEWNEFVERYSPFFSDEVRMKYEEIKSLQNSKLDEIPEILRVNYVSLNIEGIPCITTRNNTNLLEYLQKENTEGL